MVREPFNRADASSLTRCWEWKTIEMWTSWDSHNNGSPIRLGSHHKSERNKRTSSSLSMFSTQVHNLYVNISGGNEMNISTSFICFHFILLYLLVFFFASSSKRLLRPVVVWRSPFACFVVRLLRPSVICGCSHRQPVDITIEHKIHALMIALKMRALPSTHLQSDPSWADVSPFTVTTCSCCVLLLKLHKKKRRKKDNTKKRRRRGEKEEKNEQT